MITKWAAEKFLPQLISELNLSTERVYFSGRIGDYLGRGDHLSVDAHSSNAYEKYTELIVRAMELKAYGMGTDLTDSFQDLENFHRETISPVICNAIKSSGITSIPFDGDIFYER